ncbi:MAG: DUF4159 domain-containing protein [Geminicoccaceae bacterium]|nr:DUF4159 domain-containing protein [Geminicoccaceae bacterium]
MLSLGPLAFLQPWLLLGLLGLPVLWLLLRLTPPAPRHELFPPLELLRRLTAREETPARTPLWLLILRMVLAAAIILALARPVLDPAPTLAGSGPLVLVVDDGWAAAPGWSDRLDAIRDLFERAERSAREVVLLRTAPDAEGVVRAERSSAPAALERLAGMAPRPWPVDRAAAVAALSDAGLDAATPLWLSDGILDGAREAALDLGRALDRLGPLTLYADPPTALPLVLRPPPAGPGTDTRATNDGALVDALVQRATEEGRRTVGLRALGPAGEVLARGEAVLEAGEHEAAVPLDLPDELRNRIARLELEPSQGIGGVVLFDERWRRRSVGIVATPQSAETTPLLAEPYYVERALQPYATIREGSIEDLLAMPISLMVLTDRRQIDEREMRLLEPWIESGGVLLRFAGPRLAAGGDALLPVPLRAGDRQLGGALSWSQPLTLAPFPAESPFAGLEVSKEATVSRQVLAQPSPGLSRATLAALEDGTPLITGSRRGKGWLILVHTTANTTWTSLPLSGLFIDILRRVLAMAPGAGGAGTGLLKVDELLDAQGRLKPAEADLERVPGTSFVTLDAGPATPPGLWAPADALEQADERARVALNVQTAIKDLAPLPLERIGGERRGYERGGEVDLLPWLLLAALLLAMADLVVSYAFRGLLPRRPARAVGAVLLVFGTLGASQAVAQDMDPAVLTQETRLAYVHTGLRDVDERSRAGLQGLGTLLAQRTTIETGEPVAVDLIQDDLALYPLLYWPVPPDHPRIPEEGVDRLEVYLRQGGLVLIDTGDAARMLPGQSAAGAGEQRLADILRDLDLPPLIHVPEDHVLTRSFYLLQDFPGRFTGQPLWVDQNPSGINDGVASMIVGANDWAGAWAVDGRGQPLLPVVPGGERQREMARRFGVNLVMYALTGNYKTDQVHVPALLERLGQ